ncbi:hypothetical protein C4E24_05320 [ANME-1 cluster archaeon AG-394-G21]|nr:hypothetical protein [ANME-1 cluster archaeon AG-394-G21]
MTIKLLMKNQKAFYTLKRRSYRMIKSWLTAASVVLIFIFFVVVGSVASSPLNEAPEPSPIISMSVQNSSDINSSAELLRFVERMLTSPSYLQSKPVVVLPGELPSNLTVDVPIPSDTDVIGSLIRSEGTYKRVKIILDVPMEPNEVIKFYRDSLKNAGWNETEGFYHHEESGFVSTTPEDVIFCRYEGKGPSLQITADSLATEEGNVSDVRLDLDTDPGTGLCTERFYGPSGEDRAEILPPLKPPEGAILRSRGSGGGDGQWQSEATIETELNVSELTTHYQEQLMKAGWELKEDGMTASFAWSRWSFNDEFGDPWSGLLLVSEAGRENTRFLYLMVYRV